MISAIIFVSILLLALFIGVTIAGGKSHDRVNETLKRHASAPGDRASIEKDQNNGRI
jgi:hypothetical protein